MSYLVLIVLLACPNALSGCVHAKALNKPGPETGLDLTLLTKGKKVIPLVYQYASMTITDVKLPDLVIHNGLKRAVTPVEIEVIGTAKGERIAEFRVQREDVVNFANQVNPQITKMKSASDAKERMAVVWGDVTIEKANIAEGATIEPGESGVLMLSRMLYVHLVGVQSIDALEIHVSVENGRGKQEVFLELPLHLYESHVPYVFPIRGNVTVHNMPLNYFWHRQSLSQEFALDIITQHPNASGQLMSSRGKNASDLSDYYIYRSEVLAAADGIVVGISDSFPDSEIVNPSVWTPQLANENVERLAGRIGYQNAGSGNYVILKHAQDEFTYYGHLCQDSIRVKQGDTVKVGQLLGLVGSTGNSSEPHLHFQAMDSPNPSTANGLPIKFIDIPPEAMNSYYTRSNSLVDSDCLHLFLLAPDYGSGKGEGGASGDKGR